MKPITLFIKNLLCNKLLNINPLIGASVRINDLRGAEREMNLQLLQKSEFVSTIDCQFNDENKPSYGAVERKKNSFRPSKSILTGIISGNCEKVCFATGMCIYMYIYMFFFRERAKCV